MMDGMKMAGMIRYFYDHKGFGPSGCTGRDGGRPFCEEMEHGLSNAGQSTRDFGDFCVFFFKSELDLEAMRSYAKLRFYKCDWKPHRHLFPRP